jgi:4-amino-4-deoxychorismate lyase
MVVDNEIDYQFKYTDRARLEELKRRTKADEILIVKNGYITDTSFSNIIFFDWENKWVTPATPLLKGTKRKELLEKGMIHEKEIRPYDLKDFTKARLINAMLDIEDGEEIETGNIFF